MTPDELKRLIGLPRARRAPDVSVVERSEASDHIVERLAFDFGDGRPVRGLLTRPAGAGGPHPAVLYCHAHGNKYAIGASELLIGRPSLIGPYGPLMAKAGFVALSLDMPTFGERADETENALAKALLWRGATLIGLMLADLLAGFDHLAARPDVDATRIATFGLSMGATHAYFLAAIEPRVARAAHLCAYADLESLVETGAHDLHGHYMTVPGLLAATSTGRIAGMVAPRPQLICTGDHDPLTPPDAVDTAYRQTRAAYRAAGAAGALVRLSQPETGHEETPQMRRAVLDFLSAMR